MRRETHARDFETANVVNPGATDTGWMTEDLEEQVAAAPWLAFALFVGLAILIYRRRSNKAVFRATTWNDKIMFLVLAIVMLLATAGWAR